MKTNKKNALSGKERAQERSEHETQLSCFHSTISDFSPTVESFSDCGSANGERGTGRAPQPDFNAPPWPGVMRAIYWSYRLNLPSLRAWTLGSIKKTAIKDELKGGLYER